MKHNNAAFRLKLKTKELQLVPMDDTQLQDKIEQEQDVHLKAAYTEMLKALQAATPNTRLLCTLWSVMLPDGTKIGTAGFMGAPQNGSVEIGYGIDAAYRSKGYATAAVKLLTEWAFSLQDVYFVFARTEAENAASVAVLTKSGFKKAKSEDENLCFVTERPASAYMSIFMCLGMSVGLCFSLSLGQNVLGMCIGMPLGIAIGTALDSDDRKKHERYRKELQQAKKL